MSHWTPAASCPQSPCDAPPVTQPVGHGVSVWVGVLVCPSVIDGVSVISVVCNDGFSPNFFVSSASWNEDVNLLVFGS